MQRLITLGDEAAWCAALEGIPHGFAHGVDHCRAMALSSKYRISLYVGESGEGRLVCPLAERPIGATSDLVTPYGPGGMTGRGELAPLFRQWRRFAEARGHVCAYIALNPVFATARALGCETEAWPHIPVHLVTLTTSEAALHAALSPNVQAGLKTWAKTGARIIDSRARLAAVFPDLYRGFVRSIEAAPVYHFNRAALDHLVASPDLLLLGAERAGELQAIAAFGTSPYAADYLFNAATDDGRDHARALIWEAMRRLGAAGIPVLNLSGGVSEGDGLDQFKARFGGRRCETESLKMVFDEVSYAERCAVVGADPSDRFGYFPAYRAPAKGGRATYAEPRLGAR